MVKVYTMVGSSYLVKLWYMWCQIGKMPVAMYIGKKSIVKLGKCQDM